MTKTIKGLTYNEWASQIAGWGMPDPQALLQHKQKRRPLTEQVKAERHRHMVQLKEKGYPVNWIARYYKLSRKQVTRIINNLPNH